MKELNLPTSIAQLGINVFEDQNLDKNIVNSLSQHDNKQSFN